MIRRPMTLKERQDLVRWFRDLPPTVQVVALRFPPGARVRARPGTALMCPRPGEVGNVISYVEHGNDPVGIRVSDGVLGASCELEWLELVDADAEITRVLRETARLVLN